jgi:hypothetical protein
MQYNTDMSMAEMQPPRVNNDAGTRSNMQNQDTYPRNGAAPDQRPVQANMNMRSKPQNGESRPRSNSINGECPAKAHVEPNTDQAISNYIPGPPIARFANNDRSEASAFSSSAGNLYASHSAKDAREAPSLYSSADHDPRAASSADNWNYGNDSQAQ